MRRTCGYHSDERLCAHELACSEADMCVLRIQQEEEAEHEALLQGDRLLTRLRAGLR